MIMTIKLFIFYIGWYFFFLFYIIFSCFSVFFCWLGFWIEIFKKKQTKSWRVWPFLSFLNRILVLDASFSHCGFLSLFFFCSTLKFFFFIPGSIIIYIILIIQCLPLINYSTLFFIFFLFESTWTYGNEQISQK